MPRSAARPGGAEQDLEASGTTVVVDDRREDSQPGLDDGYQLCRPGTRQPRGAIPRDWYPMASPTWTARI
jgi:hypothetical protein